MDRHRQYFDHPVRSARKSVVREGGRSAPRRGGQVGESKATNGAGGVMDFFNKYRTYVLIGAGALVVAIVYQVYSKRMSKKKDEEQIQNGLRAIGGGGQVGSVGPRAPLQVDPQVIEVLQQQVLDYQAQVDQLEYALNQRELQLEQIRQQQQAPGPNGAGGIMHPAASGNFAGLHGQVDPNSGGAPLPLQMHQPMATRDPSLAGGAQQQQTMGAFSMDPGLEGGASAISLSQGSVGGAGGSQFTPL